jgi:predicted transcriptional regulator
MKDVWISHLIVLYIHHISYQVNHNTTIQYIHHILYQVNHNIQMHQRIMKDVSTADLIIL